MCVASAKSSKRLPFYGYELVVKDASLHPLTPFPLGGNFFLRFGWGFCSPMMSVFDSSYRSTRCIQMHDLEAPGCRQKHAYQLRRFCSVHKRTPSPHCHSNYPERSCFV